MSNNNVAVVGVGQTQYSAVRGDVSLPGLLREATYRALDDAHLTMDDIDAIVVGKAPDFFEGIMMPETYLAEALGAVGKPLFRVHTAGSVGGSTAIVAASHVQSGVHVGRDAAVGGIQDHASGGGGPDVARPYRC